jgi:hypothetical protein
MKPFLPSPCALRRVSRERDPVTQTRVPRRPEETGAEAPAAEKAACLAGMHAGAARQVTQKLQAEGSHGIACLLQDHVGAP